MKTVFVVLTLLFSGAYIHPASNDDLQQISNVIHQFSSFADQQNIKQMDQILHKDFRAVVNRLFGSEDVALMDKAVYLDLLKQGKIGGDTRTVAIESIDIEQDNAIVRAHLSGKTLQFHTFIQLVKVPAGHWQVIGDMPKITKVE